jgi:hypothetical protein
MFVLQYKFFAMLVFDEKNKEFGPLFSAKGQHLGSGPPTSLPRNLFAPFNLFSVLSH